MENNKLSFKFWFRNATNNTDSYDKKWHITCQRKVSSWETHYVDKNVTVSLTFGPQFSLLICLDVSLIRNEVINSRTVSIWLAVWYDNLVIIARCWKPWQGMFQHILLHHNAHQQFNTQWLPSNNSIILVYYGLAMKKLHVWQLRFTGIWKECASIKAVIYWYTLRMATCTATILLS